MKLVSFRRSGAQPSPGVWLAGRGVFDIARAVTARGLALDASSMLALVRGGDGAMATVADLVGARADEFLLPADKVTLAPPIAPPRNAFCVGRNYREHVAEGHRARGTDVELPAVPQFFTKATHALNAPGGDVRLDPHVTSLLDYEVELAVILGKGGRDISAATAFDYVFGYTIANDITARDLQRSHAQWFKGKSLDGTLPLGPWIVDTAEIRDPRSLKLSLYVNGEVRQSASVDMMIFDIPTIIESLSAGMTLEAGDVICTGTPSGVGYAMDPPRALKAGDVVTCHIDRIGTLTNQIVAA